MNILVTGASGFIGKNLINQLINEGYSNISAYSNSMGDDILSEYISKCHFIFHIAGVNRTDNEDEFKIGNVDFTEKIISLIEKHNNIVPIVFTSSTQVENDNEYGKSKKAAELLLLDYSKKYNSKAFIYRLTNVFGKWSRRNYNSVVATFCYNIVRGLPVNIHNASTKLNLCYIDDVFTQFIDVLKNWSSIESGYRNLNKTYQITLGELAKKIRAFMDNRVTLIMPTLENEFDIRLYGTILSYLDEDNFSYSLKKNIDNRGWLAEFIKSQAMGQIFVSSTKPGITRGNHWHHTKVEKFLVIKGSAVIKFRKIDSDKVVEYKVSDDCLEVLDIPIGYTHSITNTGKTDLITLFWASEILYPERPDTYYVEV